MSNTKMSNPTANVLYSTPSARLDTVGSFTQEQIAVWQMIHRAYREYKRQHGSESSLLLENFVIWIRDNWGILLSISDDSDPGFKKNYKIINEEKYLLFILKWSS